MEELDKRIMDDFILLHDDTDNAIPWKTFADRRIEEGDITIVHRQYILGKVDNYITVANDMIHWITADTKNGPLMKDKLIKSYKDMLKRTSQILITAGSYKKEMADGIEDIWKSLWMHFYILMDDLQVCEDLLNQGFPI